MFHVNLAKDQEAQESGHFEEALLLPVTPQISSFEFEDATHGIVQVCLNPVILLVTYGCGVFYIRDSDIQLEAPA